MIIFFHLCYDILIKLIKMPSLLRRLTDGIWKHAGFQNRYVKILIRDSARIIVTMTIINEVLLCFVPK